MVETYFERTPRDEEFYKLYIKDRLPKTVIDAHMHLIPTQFRGEIAECERKADWALQCVSNMSYDDYLYYAKKFYPDSDVNINAFPSLSRTVDQVGSNGYIGERHKAGKIQFAHLAVRPWYTMEYITEEMNKYNFNGLKPYPDAGPGTKGGEVPIFQFLPHEQCQWLNEKKKSVVLHLPRAKRLADDYNVRELKEMREKYPDIKIVIAHFGRCFPTEIAREAVKKMGSSMKDFYFDCSAVVNPAVYELMFDAIPHDQIMYGTDLPVFLFHGKRAWTDTSYHNLARENFAWNKHEEGEAAEANYTFFLYEQLKVVLDTCDKFGGKDGGRALAEKIFHENAERIYGQN